MSRIFMRYIMKRLIALILSLVLILCSCYKRGVFNYEVVGEWSTLNTLSDSELCQYLSYLGFTEEETELAPRGILAFHTVFAFGNDAVYSFYIDFDETKETFLFYIDDFLSVLYSSDSNGIGNALSYREYKAYKMGYTSYSELLDVFWEMTEAKYPAYLSGKPYETGIYSVEYNEIQFQKTNGTSFYYIDCDLTKEGFLMLGYDDYTIYLERIS